MKYRMYCLAAALLALPAMGFAQLPALNEEEAAKKAEAAEKKAASEEAAKVALGNAQDRVAKRYRAAHPNAPHPVPVVTPAAIAVVKSK